MTSRHITYTCTPCLLAATGSGFQRTRALRLPPASSALAASCLFPGLGAARFQPSPSYGFLGRQSWPLLRSACCHAQPASGRARNTFPTPHVIPSLPNYALLTQSPDVGPRPARADSKKVDNHCTAFGSRLVPPRPESSLGQMASLAF